MELLLLNLCFPIVFVAWRYVLKKIDRKFLVFERNIERFSINMDDSRTSFNFKSKATTENIKKYKFDSNLNNTCYSICIMDYFKNM